MNAKDLYLTIGQVDDDLILAANEERSRRKKPVVRRWMIAAAACFCLLLGGGYLHFFGTAVVWNEGPAEYAAKSSVPAYRAVQSLSADTLSDYYHITLPDTLDGLSGTPADAQIYTDAQNEVVYDRNVFRYESADGRRRVELALCRVSSAPQNTGERVSRICGTSVTLTEDTSVPGRLLLGAQWEKHGTTILLAAEGLSRDELLSVLKELI